MGEIALEAYRFLKPGGRILTMDLAWDEQHCDQYNGRLNEYIERYAFKMGNPVSCPDAHKRLPGVFRDAGFKGVEQRYFNITSPYPEKFLLWSGVSRNVQMMALSDDYPTTENEANSVIKDIEDIYENRRVKYTMPVCATMAMKPL